MSEEAWCYTMKSHIRVFVASMFVRLKGLVGEARFVGEVDARSYIT